MGQMQDIPTQPPAPPSRGRPRDPTIEARILDAALALYGRQGWLGFNLDAVARAAPVSKDALYRRWKTREALLQDALHTRWDWVAAIDEGTIRADLLQLATRTFDTFAGPYGEVALQLRADARRFAELRALAEPYREFMVHQGRGIVRRAIQRGDLPQAANPGLIMDLLIGGIINHIVSTPGRLRDTMLQNRDSFTQLLVEVVLTGVRHVLAASANASPSRSQLPRS